MEAHAALAFVARRTAANAMPASHWANVIGLELRWMAPGQARDYIARCQAAGLLAEEGDELRLTFDPKAVDVPRGFRPDPNAEIGPAQDSPARPEAPPGDDVFSTWLPRVAEARGDDIGGLMEAIEAGQEAVPGMHAEVILLRLGAEAGLDVQEAAAQALKELQA